MILRPSYVLNGISYTGKITSLYWIRAQAIWNHYAGQQSIVFYDINVYLFSQLWYSVLITHTHTAKNKGLFDVVIAPYCFMAVFRYCLQNRMLVNKTDWASWRALWNINTLIDKCCFASLSVNWRVSFRKAAWVVWQIKLLQMSGIHLITNSIWWFLVHFVIPYNFELFW